MTDASPGVPAEKAPLARPVEVVVIAVGLLLCVLMYVMYGQSARIEKVQQDGIQRGYINRAVTCDLQKGLGIKESKECQDEGVAKYRDPDIKAASGAGARASIATNEVVCWLVKQSLKNNPDSTLVLPPSLCPE